MISAVNSYALSSIQTVQTVYGRKLFPNSFIQLHLMWVHNLSYMAIVFIGTRWMSNTCLQL